MATCSYMSFRSANRASVGGVRCVVLVAGTAALATFLLGSRAGSRSMQNDRYGASSSETAMSSQLYANAKSTTACNLQSAKVHRTHRDSHGN